MSDKVVAVRSIEIVTAEIYTIRDNAARVFMDSVVQIGRRLEEAKQLVPQGEWLNYLDTKLGYKPSTAQNYMRIAREFGDGQVGLSGKTASDFFGNLGYSQLLPLLGLPEEEREQLAEEHDLAGMSSREIQALVKERDEAKEAAAAAQEKADKQGQEARHALDGMEIAKKKLKDANDRIAAQEKAAKEDAEVAEELRRKLNELAEKANHPRDLTDEERAVMRAEVAAEQAEAVQEAEARAAEALAKLEKVKNPAAHKVNFLFGELCSTFNRLREALQELAKSDQDAAGKMAEAIAKNIGGWNL